MQKQTIPLLTHTHTAYLVQYYEVYVCRLKKYISIS
jgi:hypothetical protein